MKRYFQQHRQSRAAFFFLAPIAIAAFAILSQAANAGPFVFRKIVDTHTLVPGTSEFFSFNNSDVPAIDGISVVFDTGNQTYWTATLGKSGKRKILSTSRKIPGWNGTFQQFYGDTVRISDGTVVFVGMSCGGCNSGVGLYKVPGAGGAVTKLVDMNDFLPGSSTAKFGNFPIDFKVQNGIVVFQNSQKVFAVPVAGGPVTAVAGDQDSGFKPPAPYCCIFDSPDIKNNTVVMRAGNIFGHASIQTVNVSGNPHSFRVIADGSTHPPGTVNGKNYVIDDFTISYPVIDQAFVFRAQSNQINPFAWGVYEGIYARGGGLGFNKLVDDHTPVPGGNGNFRPQNDGRGWAYRGFAASNGIVVFKAADGLGNPGLYAVRESGGTITKIIARGDPIGGFVADYFDIGPQAMSGNMLAFSVWYASFQGFGMYYTDLSNLPP